MSLSLYMDVHVPRAITRTLTTSGVNVITAQEDGCAQMPDPELLDRAGSLNRVLFTRDDDLLAEATLRQRAGVPFSGVIFAHQMRVNIGQCIADLRIRMPFPGRGFQFGNPPANQVILDPRPPSPLPDPRSKNKEPGTKNTITVPVS